MIWASSDTATASISTAGLATGAGTGATDITATDPSSLVQGTAVLTVTPATLVSITVSPVADSIAQGKTEQFTATGTYSDLSTENLTDSVTWASSDTATATVSTTGLATGVGTGAATITATDPSSLINGTAALTVTPATLVAITVSPTVDSIASGQTEQFTRHGDIFGPCPPKPDRRGHMGIVGHVDRDHVAGRTGHRGGHRSGHHHRH